MHPAHGAAGDPAQLQVVHPRGRAVADEQLPRRGHGVDLRVGQGEVGVRSCATRGSALRAFAVPGSLAQRDRIIYLRDNNMIAKSSNSVTPDAGSMFGGFPAFRPPHGSLKVP